MTEVEKRQRMTDAAFLREIATIAKDIPSYFGIEQEDVHRLNDIAKEIEDGVASLGAFFGIRGADHGRKTVMASLREYKAAVESVKQIQDLQGIVGSPLPAVHISPIPKETKRLNADHVDLYKHWDVGPTAVGKVPQKK